MCKWFLPVILPGRVVCSIFLGPAASPFFMLYQFHLLLIHSSHPQGDQAASVSWDAPSEASTCFTSWETIVHNHLWPLWGHQNLPSFNYLPSLPKGTTNEKLPAAVEMMGPDNSWCSSVLNKSRAITHKSQFKKAKHLTYWNHSNRAIWATCISITEMDCYFSAWPVLPKCLGFFIFSHSSSLLTISFIPFILSWEKGRCSLLTPFSAITNGNRYILNCNPRNMPFSFFGCSSLY